MFQIRSGAGASPATAGGGRQQPTSIDAMRRQARRRLIGAAVLVALAVIVLPLLLESQPRPIPLDISIDIPPRDGAEPLSWSDAEQETAPKGLGTPPDEPVAAPTTAAPAPVGTEQNRALPAPAAVPAAPTAPAAQHSDGDAQAKVRVVVQVGAFADAARAQEVRSRLERAGLKTYIHIADTPDGKRIRVRVGPFDSRAQAVKVAEQVKALGLPATVLTL